MGETAGWAALGAVLAVLVVLAVAWWMSWTATRLDRMHVRVEAAEASLRAHLQHRASVALELAASGLTDPASALLMLDASRRARETEDAGPDHWHAESDLTAVLAAVDLPPPRQEPLVGELVEAARRAAMSRRIHNDLAATARALHRRRRVRWFRLAGHAAVPPTIEFDDRADFAGQHDPSGPPDPPEPSDPPEPT